MRVKLVLFAVAGLVEAQVISTVAGTEWLFPPTPIPGPNAPLGRVDSIAVDSKGNAYVSDTGNGLVFKMTPDRTVTVFAGSGKRGFSGDGGPANRASLSSPTGIAIDGNDNVYICDGGVVRIRMVAPDGTINTIAGNGTRAYAGDNGPAKNASFLSPRGLAADSAGNVYVSDPGANVIRRIAADGTITTFAGTGVAGFAGDGGPARNAQFRNPSSLTVDTRGDLYVADQSNYRIRKISSGIIRTVAGAGIPQSIGDGGPALSAGLVLPSSVAVDADGTMYIAELSGQKIRKVNPEGIISTLAGTGAAGYEGDGGPATFATMNTPTGVALMGGNLLVADSANNFVRRIFPGSGIINLFAGSGDFRYGGDGGPAANAFLSSPGGVVFHPASGTLYIADSESDRIRKVTKDGIITTAAGSGIPAFAGDRGPANRASLRSPRGVALDVSGNLYIADAGNNRIRRVSAADGIIVTIAGGGTQSSGEGLAATSVSLIGVAGLAFDRNGELHFSESAGRIRKITSAGTVVTVAGNPVLGPSGFAGDGGPATSAQFRGPTNIAFDTQNSLYIVDSGNYRVRKVTNGIITTVVGMGVLGSSGDGGPATSATILPSGIAFDSSGALYVTDTSGHRIRKVVNGVINTIAGTGGAGFSGDGGPPASAMLFGPGALHIDAAGDLYFADQGNYRIRKIQAGSAAYEIVPSSMSFTAEAGGAPPNPQTITLTPVIAGLPFTVAAPTTSGGDWLSVSPTSGAMPLSLEVKVNSGSLTPGTYQGSVNITAPSAVPPTRSVPVVLTIQAGATRPQLSVDTRSLALTSLEGGAELTRQIRVSNSGTGTLNFTAEARTTSGGGWLFVAPANGQATPSIAANLTVTARPGNLGPGTYQGRVTISTEGAAIDVTVSLAITAANRVILVSQSALNFTAIAQGGSPLFQNFGILNTGQGSMNWSATAQTLSGGNWLQITPASGTVVRPFLDVSTVRVTIAAAGLPAGEYYGRVQVSAAAANSPQMVMVLLKVLPPGSNPGPEVRPTGLIFTGEAGSSPSAQDVLVGNPRAQDDSYLSGSIGKGFTHLPTNATVSAQQPLSLRVFPEFDELAPGAIERGVITLLFGDGATRTVSVLNVVAPVGGSAAAKDGREIAACRSPNLRIQHRSLRAGFDAVVGQPTTVEVQVVDDCGVLIGPNRGGSAVTVSFSNRDPNLNLTHVGEGIWVGTWRPVQRSSSSVLISVTAFQVEGITILAGQVDLAGNLSTSSAPIVTSGGVVHAASSRVVPIAPGSLITLYGSNLGTSATESRTYPLPLEVDGLQVLLGDRPLPVYFVNPTQMNVQVPFDLAPNTHHQVIVRRGTALSVPDSLSVADAQPGIFLKPELGVNQGAIVKSDQITVAKADTPAAIGETIVIYCTGLGEVNPPVPAGAATPFTDLSRTTRPVTVRIGGLNAKVDFAGLTPGFAGLYQVNAVVPEGIAVGDQVPVEIEIAGQVSPAAFIAVR